MSKRPASDHLSDSSSDDEDHFFRPNGSTVGSRITNRILSLQEKDHRKIRREAKTLRLQSGAPIVQLARERVCTSWTKWYEGRRISLRQCPTSEQILEFIITLVNATQTTLKGKSAPLIVTIRGSWKLLIQYLEFAHKDLRDKYTQVYINRINEYLAQYVDNGKPTKGRWMERPTFWYTRLYRIPRIPSRTSWFGRNCSRLVTHHNANQVYRSLSLILRYPKFNTHAI